MSKPKILNVFDSDPCTDKAYNRLCNIVDVSVDTANSSIVVQELDEIEDSTVIIFKAPCHCSEVSSLSIGRVSYRFIDSSGEDISDLSDLFSAGTLVALLINNNDSTAHILSNSVPRWVFDAINGCPTYEEMHDAITDITYTHVGAAPAGYGIGTLEICSAASDDEVDSKLTEQINSIGNQTFKRFVLASTNTANFIGGGYYYADIYKMGSTHAIITIKSYLAGGRTLQRVFTKESNETSASLKPWEWVNPPLSIGVEYRTTERFYGEPVYVKAIDFGLGPSTGSGSAYISDNVGDLVRVEGYWTDGSFFSNGLRFPFASANFITDISIREDTDADGNTSNSLVVTAPTPEEADGHCAYDFNGFPIVYYTKRKLWEE